MNKQISFLVTTALLLANTMIQAQVSTFHTGFVGIGTKTPQVPLHVVGSNVTISGGGLSINYFSHGTQELTPFYWGGEVNAIFEGNVVSTAAFMAAKGSPTFSDQRFKNIIGQSNSKSDLDKLNKIKITDYHYIDKVKLGSAVQKKVIAQEVEEILPSAISKITTFAPTVYEVASEVKSVDNTLHLTLTKSHGFAKGDKVKWVAEDGKEYINEVVAVTSDKSFTLNTTEKAEKVFIYGKEVNDFRTVDYDAISMLNVSATQELYKRIVALEAENASLKTDNASLKADVQSIKAQLGISSQSSAK